MGNFASANSASGGLLENAQRKSNLLKKDGSESSHLESDPSWPSKEEFKKLVQDAAGPNVKKLIFLDNDNSFAALPGGEVCAVGISVSSRQKFIEDISPVSGEHFPGYGFPTKTAADAKLTAEFVAAHEGGHCGQYDFSEIRKSRKLADGYADGVAALTLLSRALASGVEEVIRIRSVLSNVAIGRGLRPGDLKQSFEFEQHSLGDLVIQKVLSLDPKDIGANANPEWIRRKSLELTLAAESDQQGLTPLSQYKLALRRAYELEKK